MNTNQKNHKSLAKDILRLVGGKENISELIHCTTRLRFRLKDENKADDETLEKMDGVVAVAHCEDQYQVVIGGHVSFVYADVCELAGIRNIILVCKLS